MIVQPNESLDVQKSVALKLGEPLSIPKIRGPTIFFADGPSLNGSQAWLPATNLHCPLVSTGSGAPARRLFSSDGTRTWRAKASKPSTSMRGKMTFATTRY